jgi:hypothetical protein
MLVLLTIEWRTRGLPSWSCQPLALCWYRDAMDGADDDAISLSHMNSPKVDMVMALLGYTKKDRLSAQNSPADSAACMFYLHDVGHCRFIDCSAAWVQLFESERGLGLKRKRAQRTPRNDQYSASSISCCMHSTRVPSYETVRRRLWCTSPQRRPRTGARRTGGSVCDVNLRKAQLTYCYAHCNPPLPSNCCCQNR